MTQVETKQIEEPIEYFIKDCEFKFCYQESQDPNFAELLIESLNNKNK